MKKKKRCLIVYFSQWNTTESIAVEIAKGLKASRYDVQLHNLKGQNTIPDAGEFDLLGIGTPVYYYREPFNVSKYIQGLPPLNQKPAFVFLLHGSYPEDTFTSIWNSLRKKNAKFAGLYHSKGKDIYYEYLNEGYLFSPEEPSKDYLKNARLFGKQLAKNLKENHCEEPPVQKKARIMHRIERSLASEFLTRIIISQLFRVNRKICDSCRKCEKVCPTENITMIENKGLYPAFGRNCLLCLSCELKCHTGAIQSPASWKIFKGLIRHNVLEASTDPELTNRRVQIIKGRIKPFD